jgi:uncharacterized protein YfaS (alpha-2-macroglobulin family)
MCNSDKNKKISDPKDFINYITAFSPNVISKNDKIIIQFSDSFFKSIQKIETSFIDISPNVNGKFVWKNNTIEFTPEKPLKSGHCYTINVNLSKLDKNCPKLNKNFIFAVNTKKQFLNVYFDKIKTTDKEKFTTQDVYYKIKLNDGENIDNLKKCFSIDTKNDFELEQNNELEYSLIVKAVKRKSKDFSNITLSYDGTKIEAKNKDKIYNSFPPTSEFQILDIQANQSPEQHINIVLSDPVKDQQYLDGLITLSGQDNLKFIIANNVIKVIPDNRLTTEYMLKVSEAIKNINNKKLTDGDFMQTVSFVLQKPELRLVHNGVILPSAKNKQIIAFEAINIKAVDVKITQIYESNILQFLQNNNLNEESYLNFVGKMVATKTIDLQNTDVESLEKFNTFYIDISNIVKIQSGAIYRIELNFRKENAIFTCESSNNINDQIVYLQEDNDWSWFDSYTYYSYENGNDNYDNYYYEESENYEENSPCNKYFYGHKNALSFNILASNIGLIAKSGQDNKIIAYVTNILDAKPTKDAKVEIFNFQQQLIASTNSDSDGKAILNYKKNDEPYFVVATKGNEKAYITLREYNALYTSKFDVSGENIQNGTSAFIYTERGVWRPGDSIFVGFIINEQLEKTPVGIPISMEVKNPQNQIIFSEIQEKNEKGFHIFKFKTDQNAPTGYYSATFKFGGQTFYKTLMVETIKPNRLNINLDFDKPYISGDGSVNAILNATWLQGGAAAFLDFTTNVSFSLISNPFPNYKDYYFNNNAVDINNETTEFISGKTNEKGEYKAPVKFNKLKNAPGVLNANLTTKILEKGGNINISEKKIIYFPYFNYIGFKTKYDFYYPQNKAITFDFISLERNGKPSKTKRDIEISVYFVENYYWYDYSENNVDFITANYNNAVLREKYKFTTEGKYDIIFSDAGYYYVVAKDMQNGQIVAKQIYVSSYSQETENNSEMSDSPEILKFKTDKEKYNVGEKINVNIPLGEGFTLVSIENSTQVLQSFWKETNSKGFLEFNLTAEANMTPNVYLNITFIQKYEKSNNDNPLRIYGIIPINVENPETHIFPKITMAEELQAESKVKITVSEEKGNPMTYTIAMVDEGLLALTNFKTPNPWETFYSKQALGVHTWDIYDEIIKAFAINANRILSIGGDMSEASNNDIVQANRFKPMVRFIGPFTLGKNKSKTHEIQLPQYIGAVRTMVIAANDNSYGCTEKTTPVIKPLMILGTAPRKIGINETFKIPVTVFAMKPDIKNVNISIKTNDKLSIIGNRTKSVNFSKIGDKFVEFDIKANSNIGIGTIEIIANCGEHTSKYNIELDVKYLNEQITENLDGFLDKEEFNKTFTPFGIKGTNSAILEIYSMPPINLEKRLDYLISYPHGCIEQTVSSAFPQLYIENLITIDTTKKAKIQRNITACINKLKKFQLSNGGFSYWQGDNYANDWGSSYAGHFLLEAEKAGFDVPSSMKSNWLKYQKNISSKWIDKGSYSQTDQAYRLYTMALAGSADRSAMNRLKETKLTNAASWCLSDAYAISGKIDIAKQIITKLNTNIVKYSELSGTFGSDTRDKAIILETLITVKDKNKAFLVLQEIANVLGSDTYCSTQTTAFSLMAISKYVKIFGVSNQLNCLYSINGKEYSAKTSKSVFNTNLKINDSENTLTIKSANSDILYIRIVLKGIPEAGTETTESSFINMNITYTNLDGQAIDISKLSQGTDFIATVTLSHSNPAHYSLDNLALTQIFPSGWEILNSRMYTTVLGENSYFNYQDIRDDRILTYFSMSRSYSYTYKVMLTASYAGEFYFPAVICETMYDNTNYAREKGLFVKVVNN